MLSNNTNHQETVNDENNAASCSPTFRATGILSQGCKSLGSDLFTPKSGVSQWQEVTGDPSLHPYGTIELPLKSIILT